MQQAHSQGQPRENRLQGSVELDIGGEGWQNTLWPLKEVEPGLSIYRPMGRGFRNKMLGISVIYCHLTNHTKTQWLLRMSVHDSAH